MKSSSLLRAGGEVEEEEGLKCCLKTETLTPGGFILPSGGGWVRRFLKVYSLVSYGSWLIAFVKYGKGDHLLSFHGVNVCLNL